jgi:hypothetical protein
MVHAATAKLSRCLWVNKAAAALAVISSQHSLSCLAEVLGREGKGMFAALVGFVIASLSRHDVLLGLDLGRGFVVERVG